MLNILGMWDTGEQIMGPGALFSNKMFACDAIVTVCLAVQNKEACFSSEKEEGMKGSRN